MADHNELGRQGEQIAASYLQNEGYHILERNWRHERVELDLILEKADLVVFVEVKTRSTDHFGYPEDAITSAKQENLLSAAEAYVELNDIDREIRFDVVSIILVGKEHRLHHIEDAISPYDM